MYTKDVYQNIDCLKIINKIDKKLNNVSTDTRKIKENDYYFGIKGDNFDGNDFYKDAFLKGATLAILEHVDITPQLEKYLQDNDKSIILVKDTVIALGELAKYKRSLFKNPVVAVTGSVGKTSTKDMIYSVLKEKYKAHKTIGNQNNQIGLPLSILGLEQDTEILVLELGMNHLKEISYLTSIAKPDVAVITNVGTAHIGNLGSRENILKAKLEILEGLNKSGTLIINNDNDLLHEWYLKNKNNYNIMTIGFKNDADFKATNIDMSDENSKYTCNNNEVIVPVVGEHFIYNSLVALAVGSIFKINHKLIQQGLNNFEASRNSTKKIYDEENNITIIDDSYNANFDSVKYAIKYLSSFPGQRIAILGTMLELGKYSSELHANLGNIIYEENIDVLITLGEYTNLINERAISLGFNKKNSYHFTKKTDVINFINKHKKPGDVYLAKASHSMNFQEIIDKIK